MSEVVADRRALEFDTDRHCHVGDEDRPTAAGDALWPGMPGADIEKVIETVKSAVVPLVR